MKELLEQEFENFLETVQQDNPELPYSQQIDKAIDETIEYCASIICTIANFIRD